MPFASNVDAGAAIAAERSPDLVLFEGSGATFPPVETRKRVLVVGGRQRADIATGYLNAYRILVSDLVVVVGGDEPVAAIRELTDVPVLTAELRPRPVEPIEGSAAVFTTAPPDRADDLRERSHDQGVDVVHLSTNLARRDELQAELDATDAEHLRRRAEGRCGRRGRRARRARAGRTSCSSTTRSSRRVSTTSCSRSPTPR